MTTRTYRGRSLEELLPQVRAELGPDAVIVRQREGLTGGVGGFFQKRMVEIEATAGEAVSSIDVRDDSPATPDFLDQLSQAQTAAEGWSGGVTAGWEPAPATGWEAAPEPQPEPEPAFTPYELPETLDDETWSEWATDQLPPAAAPAVRPVVTDRVPELPTPEPVARAELVAAPDPPPPAAVGRWPEDARVLRDALVARGLEAPLADGVLEETVTHVVPFAKRGAKLRPLVAGALARRIPVQPVGAAPGRVVAFVGPGGAGKTHCAGHLAGAYAQTGGLPVACVAVRPADAGAELALLLAPAGVPMRVAPDAASAGAHTASLRAGALVLVDTPGVSPRDRGALRALQAELRAAGVDDVVLCLPATMSAGAAEGLVAAGQRLGARALALTHADETDHLGPAVGVAMQSGLPFAYVGQAANGVPAVRPAVAEELAKALLGSSARSRRR